MASSTDVSTACVHQLFEAQARRTPHAPAVRLRDACLSYAQLDERASLLALHLQQLGVHPGDVVALAMARSIDMIAAMLAILKCGAAYLPLDESNPPARARLCLDDARVRHVLADRNCAELCTGARFSIDVAELGRCVPTLAQLVPPALDANAPAYVMFTSGSTGRPKGVVVPHRAVVRLVVAASYIQIRDTDKILQFSPTSFDASTFEIWGALLNGAELVLYSQPGPDPNALRNDIAQYGVTILWLTAALFHLISHRYAEALRPLRVLLAGGDVLSPKAVNAVLDALPALTVINGYGPTENTTFTCCHRMTSANPPGVQGVPIGKPISGTEVFVLDGDLQPVVPGEVGELFAAGRGVALGYLHGDAGGRFFTHSKLCSGLIYRTGDLVRCNDAGELQFIGRVDNQVKIRGFRISLEEIKLHLLAIAGVVDAVVLPHKEDTGDQLLVAHLEIQPGSGLDVARIRRQLAQLLPRYMIPDQIVLSQDLPITRNGKLDRNALLSSTS